MLKSNWEKEFTMQIVIRYNRPCDNHTIRKVGNLQMLIDMYTVIIIDTNGDTMSIH